MGVSQLLRGGTHAHIHTDKCYFDVLVSGWVLSKLM